jgi:hypothetical protein
LQGVSPSPSDTKVNRRSFAVKRIALRKICSIREKGAGFTAIAACGFQYNLSKGVQSEDVLFWIGVTDVVDFASLLCRDGKERAATAPPFWIVFTASGDAASTHGFVMGSCL